MISKPLSKAKAARCFFYVQLRESFEPPALAVISNQVASGWCTWPRRCRQRRMDLLVEYQRTLRAATDTIGAGRLLLSTDWLTGSVGGSR